MAGLLMQVQQRKYLSRRKGRKCASSVIFIDFIFVFISDKYTPSVL